MAYNEPEIETSTSLEHYDRVVAKPQSASLTHLVNRLEAEGVHMPNLTGDVYDIVTHSQLVGAILMESFVGDPNSHINSEALRAKIGEIAIMRELDTAQYIAAKGQWRKNVQTYQDTHPEIVAAQSLQQEAADHPLQPLVTHVLLSMGALLDDTQDNTATLGIAIQAPRQESA